MNTFTPPRKRSWMTALVYFLAFFSIYWMDWSVATALGEPFKIQTIFWSLLWPVAITFLLVIFHERRHFFILGIALISTTLLSTIDKTYFSYFNTLPSVSSLSSMHQMLDVHYSIYVLLSFDTLIPLLAGVFLLFYSTNNKNKYQKQAMSLSFKSNTSVLNTLQKYSTLSLLSFLFISTFIPWSSSLATNKSVNIQYDWVEHYSAKHFAASHGIVIYHLYDIASHISDSVLLKPIPNERKTQIADFLKSQQKINQQPTPLFGVAKDRNVVFIQLESWSEFLTDLMIVDTAVTPFFSTLKESGLYFNNIYDVTLHGRTSDAEFAVMTGLLPDTRKPAQMSHMESYFQSIPNILKNEGYQTMTVHGLDGEIWNQAVAHKRYGIDNLYFNSVMQEKNKIGLGISDEDVFQFAIEKISETKGRYFNFIISLTSHHPFIDIPEEYKEHFASLTREDGYGLLPNYLRSVKYTDNALAKFFDSIKKMDSYNNTVFILYGDHDSGALGTTKSLNDIDIFSVENDKIPLLVLIPGEEERLKQFQQTFGDKHGGLHDLPATLLHLLGMEIPVGFVGTNLLNNMQDNRYIPLPTSPLLAASNRGVISGNNKPDRTDVDFKTIFDQQLMVRDILDFKLLMTENLIEH